MKLAILGTDEAIVELVAAALREHHEIAWLGDVRTEDRAAIGGYVAALSDRASEWELLLDRAVADAVLIGRGTAASELHVERIKRLAAAGVTMLVVHPVFDSVLPYYEIDMARRESGAVIQHYNPLIGHPVVSEVAAWLRDGHESIGTIHQLSCERRVATADREIVLAHFARDVELLSAVVGDIRRVTAIGPSGKVSSFASLQMQMTADESASVRWSVGYAKAAAVGLQMSLLAEDGSVTLRILDGLDGNAPMWLIDSSEEDTVNQPLEPYDPAGDAIGRLAAAVGASYADRIAAASTWDAATRAMEVVDAADLSLQKGRTIEVYQQQLTQRLAFRGTMAALGCGLLLVAFVALVAIGILGGAEGIVRQRLAPSWPLVLLALLAFFLLLQAVPLLARKPDAEQPAPPTSPRDHNP